MFDGRGFVGFYDGNEEGFGEGAVGGETAEELFCCVGDGEGCTTRGWGEDGCGWTEWETIAEGKRRGGDEW